MVFISQTSSNKDKEETRLCRLDASISPDRPSLTPEVFTGYFLQHLFCVIHNYLNYLSFFGGWGVKPFKKKIWGGGVNLKKKSSEVMIHGSHKHVNVYLKPWFLAHEKKKNSQMRFQQYQAHIMSYRA